MKGSRALVIALAALALAACGSSRPASSAVSITAAPIQTVQTRLGTVGYRVVGHGRPLVLVMGYAGTIDTWDPLFVDALAQRFRVVSFDNAGIGETAALRAPLSIDAMADQTSALISALHLGRPDVLGWSMGGTIAQALAVRHPSQVRGLVLCATFPGAGQVVRPSQAAIKALTSANPRSVAADLFPANERLGFDAMSAELSRYPSGEQASAATIAAQAHASLGWFEGHDAAGRDVGRIGVPTLVADGAEDQLDAVANDRRLERLIPRSMLVLYPDAGHAFLFQAGALFVARVVSFLAPSPAPSKAAIARLVKAGQANATRVGRAWAAALKRLSRDHASGNLGAIDQPLAEALTRFDASLLEDRAGDSLGRQIETFALAEERVARDIAALSAISPGINWGAALKADGSAEGAASARLRRLLGLAPLSAGTGSSS